MSDQHSPATPEPGRQDAGSAAERPGGEVPRNWYGAPVEPRKLDRTERRTMIGWGGLLVGAGFGGGLVVVVHTIAQASPGAFPSGIGGLVVLILLLICPAFGLGAGLLAAGLVPDDPVRHAEPPTPER